MKCIYCQSEMEQYGFAYYNPKMMWVCNYHRPMRVDHWYDDNYILQRIQFVIWKPLAQFPYIISLDLINKITQLFHLPDAEKITNYNNEYQWAKCLERINQKETPIFTIDYIPENINPETVNQLLDRYLKLLSFY